MQGAWRRFLGDSADVDADVVDSMAGLFDSVSANVRLRKRRYLLGQALAGSYLFALVEPDRVAPNQLNITLRSGDKFTVVIGDAP